MLQPLLCQRTFSYLAWLPPHLLLFFFSHLYPIIQFVTHCKASAFHLQVTSIFRHDSCFILHPPLLLLKKSVLCTISLHLYLHLFEQYVLNFVFCLLKEMYYLFNAIRKDDIKHTCIESVHIFVTTASFPPFSHKH